MRVLVNNEISINYELTGDPAAQRVLVLTHGMGGTLHNWDDDLPELSKRYAVLTWDVRGHGESDKPDMPYSAEMHANDLAGLVKALGLSRVFVGGVSMGGAITQRFLIDHPGLVAGAFLMSTSSQVAERMADAWEQRAVLAETGGVQAVLDAGSRLANAHTSVRPIPEERAQRDRERQLQIPGNIYGHIVRAMKQYAWTPELQRIDVPVLILQGLQDTMCPPGGSVIMHRNIPNSQLVMLDQCGHTMYWDQPEEWRRHLLNFLDGVEAWEQLG
ncbi:MAG: alpha/beta fold hydrolase [Chloroflexi bacterium]|nr:alpha/beta fold hydrolase [Chloroflexota bacterium]